MDYKKFLNRFRTNTKTPHCSAVILAAGSSTRMGTDKSVLTLDGIPVIIRAVQAFEKHDLVDEIIVVTKEESVPMIADLCAQYALKKVRRVMAGGATRAESSLIGVTAVDKKAEYIAIHDGARPLITQKVITDALYAARDYHAAVPVIPSTDTLRMVENGFIGGDVDRDSVIRIQTPQTFTIGAFKEVYHGLTAEEKAAATDVCSLFHQKSLPVGLIAGDHRNIKLTFPSDMQYAQTIL